jgi:hypothetical protein
LLSISIKFSPEMNARRKITQKIEEKNTRIADLQRQLAEEIAHRNGLQEALKFVPAEPTNGEAFDLREGTDAAKVRDILKAEGKPIHLDEILKRMGKEATRNAKGALAGSLGYYVKKHIVFTRPGRNIFGLMEFDKTVAVEQEEEEEADPFA